MNEELEYYYKKGYTEGYQQALKIAMDIIMEHKKNELSPASIIIPKERTFIN